MMTCFLLVAVLIVMYIRGRRPTSDLMTILLVAIITVVLWIDQGAIEAVFTQQ